MTNDRNVHPTPENPSPEQHEARSSYPVRVDEHSLFTRADLQKTLLLELPADLRSRLMEPPAAAKPVAPAFDEADAYKGHTLRMERKDLDRLVSQAQQQEPQSAVAVPAREAPAGLDPMATLYDGGALREQALKLSEALAGAAGHHVAEAPVEPGAAGHSAAQHAPQRRLGFGAVAGAWRSASPTRRAIAVLLPLAALATLWPDGAAEARSTAPARAPMAKRQGAPAQKGSAAPSPVAESPPSPTAAAPAAEASPTQRVVESQALKAAFTGDAAAAAKHYERLARELGDPRFELALRLVRTDAVRRP